MDVGIEKRHKVYYCTYHTYMLDDTYARAHLHLRIKKLVIYIIIPQSNEVKI